MDKKIIFYFVLLAAITAFIMFGTKFNYSKELISSNIYSGLKSASSTLFNINQKKTNYRIEISNKTHEFVNGIPTNVYSYNNQIPGPLITGNVGETITVEVINNMDEPTTVHWHGLQVDNDQDGVPDITQKEILPKKSMLYTLDLKNPGTYWYHSHFKGHEQVESGLSGPLVVYDEGEEEFNDELILMFDDVLLDGSYQFREFDLGRMHGRFGNILLINGAYDPTIESKGGNVRIRLINSANARTFYLSFGGRDVSVIGKDIGRSKPYNSSLLQLSPGERFDILITAENKTIPITHYSSRQNYRLGEISFSKKTENSDFQLKEYKVMPEFVDEELFRREPDFNADLIGFMKPGKGLVWAINNKHYPETTEVFEVEEGQVVKMRITNTQGQPHPMHLHGQKFIILSKNNVKEKEYAWKDTVLLGNRETVDIAFVAEEKGEWIFHCHIFEHAEAGMMSILKVL